MSNRTRSPVRIAGATTTSGAPNTMEVNVTDGGELTATIWSGNLLTNASLTGCQSGASTSGGHTLLYAGPGRLNRILVHSIETSGQPVTFYDAGAIAPSGISVSGQRFIGRIPPRSRATLALASGQLDTSVTWNDVINAQMPFTSGLCVAAASGSPGFTVSFSVEATYPLN